MIQFLNAAAGTASTAEMLLSFLPMILIIVFMIVLIYLPQKRQDKKDAAMRSSIEIGDKVTTIGGIVGIVCAIADKDDTIVIETGSDRTKIRFRRSAISSVEKLDTGKDSKSTPPCIVLTVQGGVLLWLKICANQKSVLKIRPRRRCCCPLAAVWACAYCCWRWRRFC